MRGALELRKKSMHGGRMPVGRTASGCAGAIRGGAAMNDDPDEVVDIWAVYDEGTP